MSKIETNVITRGHTSGGAEREVVNTLQDCYKRFESKAPYKIEIVIVQTETMMHDFLRNEKFRLNITTSDDEESFCFYDSWHGYPRITVSLDKLANFTKLARKGALRHEAAHSVLHGSLEFRIFKISHECQQIG